MLAINLAVAGGALGVGSASAVTLFDPALGLPSAQQWTSSGAGSFSATLSGGRFVLSTAPANATVAGSAYSAPQLLATTAGFSLDFDLRIASESHAADNQRAGFSLIVTGADPTHALELGFWQDTVFAYDSAFAPATAAAFDTTSASRYSLQVSQDHYSLFGNGGLLFGGSLVDYSGRGIPPYTVGGLIFFGDDTSRAQSVSELGRVTLAAPVPEPASSALLGTGLAALAALAGLRRRCRPGAAAGGWSITAGGSA